MSKEDKLWGQVVSKKLKHSFLEMVQIEDMSRSKIDIMEFLLSKDFDIDHVLFLIEVGIVKLSQDVPYQVAATWIMTHLQVCKELNPSAESFLKRAERDLPELVDSFKETLAINFM